MRLEKRGGERVKEHRMLLKKKGGNERDLTSHNLRPVLSFDVPAQSIHGRVNKRRDMCCASIFLSFQNLSSRGKDSDVRYLVKTNKLRAEKPFAPPVS